MHAWMFCLVTTTFHFPVYYTLFFVVAGVVDIMERSVKRKFRTDGKYKKWMDKIPKVAFMIYTNVVVWVLCYLLHWPDYRSTGLLDRLLRGVFHIQNQLFGLFNK